MSCTTTDTEHNFLHIFDIERFAIHDGPGIRTVVFLQGCPLHCPWCANPESWQIKPMLMYLESKCVQCGQCKTFCPVNAITLFDNKLKIDREHCTCCGQCVQICPKSAFCFTGKMVSVTEIMNIVMRDKDYYDNSSGGITLSGGEPFNQYEGAMNLLCESKKAGLHTAVETTGNIEPLLFDKTLSLTDLYLFDIKHCDPVQLKETTGGNLDLILYNLHTISERYPQKIMLRAPVIPGFNDNVETIDGIFKIALKNNIFSISLLPYHTLGKNKFPQLGIDYPYNNELPILRPEQLIPLCERGKKQGLNVYIGR